MDYIQTNSKTSTHDSEKLMAICPHYFGFVRGGVRIPLTELQPANQKDSGKSALCFNCLDLVENGEGYKVDNSSICEGCFQLQIEKLSPKNKKIN